MAVVTKVKVEEELQSFEERLEQTQSNGIFGSPDSDLATKDLFHMARRVKNRLDSLSEPKKGKGKEVRAFQKALKQLAEQISEGHKIISVTERQRGYKQTIGQFVNTRRLPGCYQPIDKDRAYGAICITLLSTADNIFHVGNHILDAMASDVKKWEDVKELHSYITKVFTAILRRLPEVPFLADEFLELIVKILSAVKRLRLMASNIDSQDQKSYIMDGINIVEAVINVHSRFPLLVEEQNARIAELTTRYKPPKVASDRVKMNEPAALVQKLLTEGIAQITTEVAKGVAPTPSEPSGYGTVYEVQLIDGSKVAVKAFKKNPSITDENICLRIQREASVFLAIGGSGTSDKLVQLKGFWKDFLDVKWPCLVMDWYDGGNLWNYLQLGQETVSLREKLGLLLDAAEGILFLHNCNPQIVHGDIKSENILVRNGKAAVADFGIARIINQSEAYQTNGRAGSTGYWAPEILLGLKEVGFLNPTTDMFAFGTLFLQTMINQLPYMWLEPAEREEALKAGLTPFDVPPPGAPPTERVSDLLVEGYSRLGLGSHTEERSAEPHPKTSAEPEPIFSPIKEHWRFMDQCWSRNPWRRPTASVAVAEMRKFMEGCSS